MSVSSKIKETVLLPIVIDTAAPITIAAQIIEQIKLLVVLGKLQPNQALPPLARLAEHLGISHNTVISVYNELIAAGYSIAHRGKGTFIADSTEVRQLANRKHLYYLLQEAFSVAERLGISAADFGAAAYAQAVIHQRHKLNLVFVNFFPDNIRAVESLTKETGLSLVSVEWLELKDREPQALKQVLGADLIVTTVKHLWDVADLMADSDKEVIGIDVQPDLELLSRISSLPRNAKVLLVCRTQAGSEAMQLMIKYNINHLEPTAVTLDCVQNNTQHLREFELVICSPEVESQIAKYLLPHKLMVFGIRIDPLNLLVLQARLATVGMEKSL